MTLYKQLSLLVLGLFVALVLTLSWGQLVEMRGFLYRQMGVELDNSSQALSMMLKPHMEQADKVSAEALVSATFDGGLYQSIDLTWLADGSVKRWHSSEAHSEVPRWFSQLGWFQPQQRNLVITSGWLQLGELTMTTHPGYAYRQLWNSLVNLLLLSGGLLLLTLGIARWGLHRLLKPLHAIQSHAEAVAQHHFDQPIAEPATRELAALVRSINSMEQQLQQQFQAHADQVSRLQSSLLADAVSGLANRQHLNQRLSSWLSEPGEGMLAMISVPLLEQIRGQFGYQLRDETIQQLAQQLTKLCDPLPGSAAFRISANEFAVLAMDLDLVAQHQLAEQLQQWAARLEQNSALSHPDKVTIGVVVRLPQHDQAQLLAEADGAMRQAQQLGEPLHWFKPQQQPVSQQQWRSWLIEALEQPMAIYLQPVQDWQSHGVKHYELFGRLCNQGEAVHANQFLPYLNLLGLGSTFDRCLLQQVVADPRCRDSAHPLSINLTSESINHPPFRHWLASLLEAHPSPLQFEISEQQALRGGSNLLALRQMLKKLGYPFGIDHFGRDLGSVDYLRVLLPDYVRLDHSFGDTQGQQELAQALSLTAQGLQIDTYLCGVEQTDALVAWQDSPLAGYQGFIAPPQPWSLLPEGTLQEDTQG
ncbi:bifunctional diguanylate cyclase/phosphodiesterase [Ferrimonas marina]|uniref:EAL domain, c-di-GMP-specific phosphodiesterase class I (Or its enzymatically inactive variant) n=1 Tax=Ferrimonas marina TaxID=299255 RepID=A0A1M5XV06_9GAMM|nr:EAL domain-containing protein [Ferrimonas marina]SHI03637.1 EAL domain, c-di-GMP-specific phosphodiesterase class I (or its enzymatically inactive variant) [Ferrimonas marina]